MDRPELAHFLRTRRERLRPSDVGLAAGPRRRTPGLRREEVAGLSAISVDYYTRLEQGRGPQPSRQVLTGLARALRLSDDECAHLFHLAGEQCSPQVGPVGEVRPGILHLLDRLDEAAAMVIDIRYNVLAWNHLAATLICDFAALQHRERNLVRLRFFGDRNRRYTDDENEQFGRDVVANLRIAAAKYPDDTELKELIDELLTGSKEFAALWADHEVGFQRGLCKTIIHPEIGPIVLQSELLVIPDRDQRVIIYTAEPGSPSHNALQLLKVIGTQDLSPAQP